LVELGETDWLDSVWVLSWSTAKEVIQVHKGDPDLLADLECSMRTRLKEGGYQGVLPSSDLMMIVTTTRDASVA